MAAQKPLTPSHAVCVADGLPGTWSVRSPAPTELNAEPSGTSPTYSATERFSIENRGRMSLPKIVGTSGSRTTTWSWRGVVGGLSTVTETFERSMPFCCSARSAITREASRSGENVTPARAAASAARCSWLERMVTKATSMPSAAIIISSTVTTAVTITT